MSGIPSLSGLPKTAITQQAADTILSAACFTYLSFLRTAVLFCRGRSFSLGFALRFRCLQFFGLIITPVGCLGCTDRQNAFFAFCLSVFISDLIFIRHNASRLTACPLLNKKQRRPQLSARQLYRLTLCLINAFPALILRSGMPAQVPDPSPASTPSARCGIPLCPS